MNFEKVFQLFEKENQERRDLLNENVILLFKCKLCHSVFSDLEIFEFHEKVLCKKNINFSSESVVEKNQANLVNAPEEILEQNQTREIILTNPSENDKIIRNSDVQQNEIPTSSDSPQQKSTSHKNLSKRNVPIQVDLLKKKNCIYLSDLRESMKCIRCGEEFENKPELLTHVNNCEGSNSSKIDDSMYETESEFELRLVDDLSVQRTVEAEPQTSKENTEINAQKEPENNFSPVLEIDSSSNNGPLKEKKKYFGYSPALYEYDSPVSDEVSSVFFGKKSYSESSKRSKSSRNSKRSCSRNSRSSSRNSRSSSRNSKSSNSKSYSRNSKGRFQKSKGNSEKAKEGISENLEVISENLEGDSEGRSSSRASLAKETRSSSRLSKKLFSDDEEDEAEQRILLRASNWSSLSIETNCLSTKRLKRGGRSQMINYSDSSESEGGEENRTSNKRKKICSKSSRAWESSGFSERSYSRLSQRSCSRDSERSVSMASERSCSRNSERTETPISTGFERSTKSAANLRIKLYFDEENVDSSSS